MDVHFCKSIDSVVLIKACLMFGGKTKLQVKCIAVTWECVFYLPFCVGKFCVAVKLRHRPKVTQGRENQYTSCLKSLAWVKRISF